ncbi:MAG TPA: hypothetical protein VD968_14340 [Pyrinomonadaceae bacterium]|nr:hypothetical protein [Pyrinomonadaceae bacterium]
MLRFTRLLLAVSLPALLLSALSSAAAAQGNEKEGPAFVEYKGVRIGMTADEARKKLGDPTDKGDTQDFYAFNDNESCQVFYDGQKKVFAVSVTYLGEKASAPSAKAVLGSDVEAKPDGSMHRLVRYPKAGYWVSYTRTSGDSPMTVIAMQKIQ